MMVTITWSAVLLDTRGKLLLLWISSLLSISVLQPLPLSLPVHMSAIPPAWHFLPLTQAELGPLFSNSSPFSFSQSVFMLPPPSWTPRPALQASFGPFSVTKLIPETAFPSSSLLWASLLSKGVEVERDGDGRERFMIRVVFHQRGDISNRRTCISLHAFQETEEHKSSCIPQPPLGLCVVSLSLPSSWFKDKHSTQSRQDLNIWYGDSQPGRRVQRRGRYRLSNAINHQQAISSQRFHYDVEANVPKPSRINQVQLYYSYFDIEADQRPTPAECVQDGAASSQKQLLHLQAVTLQREHAHTHQQATKEEQECLSQQEGEELWLDANVLVRYHRGPVLIGQPLRVSVNVRSNFTGQLAVIRLHLKKGLVSMVAQRTVSSDLWSVTLEKNQGSKHDGMSIYFHKYSAQMPSSQSTPLQQIVCLSVHGMKRSFDVAMTVSADWWVEYSGPRRSSSPHATAVSLFSFADRRIYGVSPITETNTIINTAILTNQPVSLPVIVLAVSRHGKMSDVTSAVTCHSTDENTIKVSSDCSLLLVDGSESGLGSVCAEVHFLLGSLRGSICLNVWVPSVPLRVTLSDPVLSAIDGWNQFTEEGCEPIYQRSSVQVLTQFIAQDSQRRTEHLLGSSDWFVDVTQLVHNWLRVEDPQIVLLNPQNILIGLRPGRTSVHVVSEQWDGFLGRCDITVTSDTVSLGDLSVQVVSGLSMSITDSPTHSSIITSTVMAYNILYNHHQEASVNVWLQFSDDTASLLSTFRDLPFLLHLSSLADTVVVVTPRSSQRILARGDGGGPLLRAELMVSSCADQQITKNTISDTNQVIKGNQAELGGRPRVLARGSGWVRVYLDLDFLPPVEKDEEEEFELDISDMLIEGESDIYTSNKDGNENVSVASDYNGRGADSSRNEVVNEGMVSRNTLERAVLMPSLGEGTLYFSSSQNTMEGMSKDEATHRRQELEVGISAILALLALFCLLFLANCLPGALSGRGRTRKGKEGDQEEDVKGEELNGKVEEKIHEEEKQNQNTKTEEGVTEVGVTEVEIIC